MRTCSSSVIKRCNHLFGEIDAVYHEIALLLGLSDSAMRILYTICDNGESCPLQEISRRSGLSKQTINSAIRKLEAEGIVSLTNSPRQKTVCLTEAGCRLANRTALRVIAMENEIFASWDPKEAEQYLALTERFLTSLTEKKEQLQQEEI